MNFKASRTDHYHPIFAQSLLQINSEAGYPVLHDMPGSWQLRNNTGDPFLLVHYGNAFSR